VIETKRSSTWEQSKEADDWEQKKKAVGRKEENLSFNKVCRLGLARYPSLLVEFFGFAGLVPFPIVLHVRVPISLSPLVAFAPAGESRNGYRRKKRLIRE
jgi:hypothetical protein